MVRRFPTVFVAMRVPEDATARLRISVTVGRWHGHGEHMVHTKPFTPNGPGCPPTVWVAEAAITSAGHLRDGS